MSDKSDKDFTEIDSIIFEGLGIADSVDDSSNPALMELLKVMAGNSMVEDQSQSVQYQQNQTNQVQNTQSQNTQPVQPSITPEQQKVRSRWPAVFGK